MNDEYTIDDPEVTRGEDGVYRWMYVMDMKENKSMLYMLLKIFAIISVGCCVIWIWLMARSGSDIGDELPKTIGIWILITAAVEGLVWLGYTISRGVMKDTYPLRYEMSETGISLYQSEKNMQQRKSGYYGRKRFRDVVSETAFNTVLSIHTNPEWDLIDLAVIGGKFQVYADKESYQTVLDFILEHVPDRVRKAYLK